MPFGDGLFGVTVEAKISGAERRLDPARLRTEHQVGPLRWSRQLRIDRRCDGVDELGPTRIPQPQGASTPSAKPAFGGALLGLPRRVGQHRAVHTNGVLTRHPEGCRVSTEVDGETPAARRLSTDSAVTEVERVRVRRFECEADRLAVARTFEFHAPRPALRLRSPPLFPPPSRRAAATSRRGVRRPHRSQRRPARRWRRVPRR